MTFISKLILWVILFALILCVVYITVPGLIGIVGLIVGYISVVTVERIVPFEDFRKDLLLFGVYIFVTIISNLSLATVCSVHLVDQCDGKYKDIFLVASIGFVGAIIAPLYLFGWIPRHIKNWMRK